MALKTNWPSGGLDPYTFETYPVGTSFNPVGGVYILCKDMGNGRFAPLYVGETESFEDRLNSGKNGHIGYARAVNLGMTHISALTVSDERRRLAIETALRHSLSPPANMQGTGSGVV